jgi:hypothetical protein
VDRRHQPHADAGPEHPVGRLRRGAIGAAIATGLALGFREVLDPDPGPEVVVIHELGEPPPLGPVTLFFHPEVPEATLVLVRP